MSHIVFYLLQKKNTNLSDALTVAELSANILNMPFNDNYLLIMSNMLDRLSPEMHT